ncbi:hypothetical protein EDC39_11167 [Geothermobacter ehrlichii]|uniref:Uncharacterized protein n=1 Tax=Geothermobacter ehrlichii TaxID=213224 RepID=A0A5D3WI36_9BACT|nr:hypothetical protein [Geothermobacter ehrlichii]TYO97137.1 hypothetical protein EDC39_11167 [Geothermobacter ehrlichii]
MIVGFNHNFRYKGKLFHVQTEDGGLRSPNIVTLLYCGGTILASKKTSYADITKVSNLEQVVEDLMKEQHREMLRRLKDGEFDDRIAGLDGVVNPAADPVVEKPKAAVSLPLSDSEPVRDAGGAGTEKGDEPEVKKTPPAPAEEPGLDDIILSYLVGDDGK